MRWSWRSTLRFDIVRPRTERGRASIQRPRLRNFTELLCALKTVVKTPGLSF
jgi:hypothetical protein